MQTVLFTIEGGLTASASITAVFPLLPDHPTAILIMIRYQRPWNQDHRLVSLLAGPSPQGVELQRLRESQYDMHFDARVRPHHFLPTSTENTLRR